MTELTPTILLIHTLFVLCLVAALVLIRVGVRALLVLIPWKGGSVQLYVRSEDHSTRNEEPHA